MVNNKTIKLLISAILILTMISTLIGTSVQAADETLTTKLSKTRWVGVNDGDEKKAYALNVEGNTNNHRVYQILSVDDATNMITGTNYYCLNAIAGTTWNDPDHFSDSVTYDAKYDLVNDKNTISNLSADEYKNVVGTNYNKVLWLLDNMYAPGGTSIETLLSNAGFKYGLVANHADLGQIQAYYYDIDGKATGTSTNAFLDRDTLRNSDPEAKLTLLGDRTTGGGYWYIGTDNQKHDVTLLDYPELVETVQQVAIWHFTNEGEYNCYTPAGSRSINYFLMQANDSSSNYTLLASEKITDIDGLDINTGIMLQEQACILYNYLVDEANKNGEYTSTSTGTLDLIKQDDTAIIESGDNYIVGPLKITTTGSVEGLAISPGTVTDETGAEKTLTANEDFYLKVAKSSIENSITITATGTSDATTKTLWVTRDQTNPEQPIVEVEKRPVPLNDQLVIPLDKQFDLALRKRIVKVEDSEGNTISIINENGNDATRNLTNIDTSSIPNTATYKHRKDPVVVDTGDIVTYRITIYNEGEIDGYASKIVDQLPTGMQSVLAQDATITSNKGTVYTITAYDTTTNKIELTADASTAKTINKFDGTTLSSDYIEIKCEVNQESATDGATKHYLTNIAYIAEGYDTENNQTVTEDRDGNESKTTQSPSQTASNLNSTDANSYKGNSSNGNVQTTGTNNDYYFEGEQDDDDFEKVVVMPKKFDLALRKFITKINSTDITTRVPDITNSELDKLANGNATYDEGTTLAKAHTKDKLAVAKGDTVVYTIRVYNEGEVDGYATEVTDYLPEGLTLKSESEINTANGWTAEGQTITTSKLSTEKITAFNKNTKTLDYKDLQVECIVNDNATSSNLKNIAEITEAKDGNGNDVTDIDSTPDSLTDEQKSNYNPETAPNGKGYQDDDDYEDLKLAEYDLALRKFISKVNDSTDFDTVTEINPSRAPQVVTTDLKAGTAETATYNHVKNPLQVNAGDYVLYTIRVYNEGDLDAYASQIIDYLPEYLDFVTGTEADTINSIWEYDNETRKVTTKDTAANATTLLKAFDRENDDGEGSGLSYVDVQIICKVNKDAVANKKLTNIAEISEYKNKEGTVVNEDRDSEPKNLEYPENPETYKDTEISSGDEYIPGQQDDDDFEKVIINEKIVDLALTKFITAVSVDDKIEDGEYLTPDKSIGSKTNEYIRATVADTTGLKAGTSTNATYTERKDIAPLVVGKNSYILYNIRVYNEGEVDVYAGEITDYLPENLEFVEGEFNTGYGWTADGQTVKTTYLSSENGTDKLLKAFDKENDDGKGSGLDYKDLPILCKVSDKAESGKKLINTAEITKYEDKDGNEIDKDIDSTPENKEEKNVENRDEDDDDYEVVIINQFDLALRKFITDIDGKAVTSRIPQLSYENGKITYTHPKDVVKVCVGNVVTYTLRVFNEGDIAGYAEEITDDIPEYLEYLPENSTNKEYRWKMYDKDGKETTIVKDAVKIVTDYTSRANGESLKESKNLEENPNLLNAFDKEKGITDTNPDYVDVKVAFKVKDPKSNKTVITNKAQISEDADKDGNPVEDIDSIPDKWNEGEDDQDYENVSVEYFDLSLLKYVTKAIVTENGKTKETKTGNTGASTDITPKVEVYRKSLNKTVVKFEYTIKITNEGDIEGYAKEITDYVPKGLKFYASDNKGWKDEGNNVISTTLLKDTLLKPGQSATVKVILRWINGENNLGLKTNVAEISKDENEKGVPDRDSTPDNKKSGEDDIDEAPVLLTISTGTLENIVAIAGGTLVILVVFGLGIVAIKRYVL